MPAPLHQSNNDSSFAQENLLERIQNSFASLVDSISEAYAMRRQAREERLRYREEMKIQQRASWRSSISEMVFVLLDYDPTDAESGESVAPTLSGAISQWLHRVVWTRRIELGGFLFILIVGVICYFAIIANS